MKNFTVLIVDDDLVISVTLGRALRAGLPGALVLTAHSLAEARLILEEDKIDFFLLDINLPDGSGIDFILDVTVHNPDAKIVLMTGTPLPEYRDQATAFGVLHFMEKPLDHQTLLGLINENRSRPAAPEGEESSLFSVALSRLTVLDILQLKCLNNSSQVLHFKSRTQGAGRVHFQNGEIIHAETERAKGIEALGEMIRWNAGYAQEAAEQAEVEHTITGSWQGVLLTAAQSADEKAEPQAEPEAEPQGEPKDETNDEAKAETEAKPKEQSEAKPKEESEAKPKEESEAKPKEESEAKPKEESEAKPKEESEAKPKDQPEAKPKEEPEAKPKDEAKGGDSKSAQ